MQNENKPKSFENKSNPFEDKSNPFEDITNPKTYSTIDPIEHRDYPRHLSAFATVEKGEEFSLHVKPDVKPMAFQILTQAQPELRRTADEYVPMPPTPTGISKDKSVKLTWDKFNYDFSKNKYFIHVYSDGNEQIIKITDAVYNTTINELENGKPYYFALSIKKSNGLVIKSYRSEQVTPLNPFATPFTPAANQQGGGNYEQKYLKYKNKYLQLKKLKKIN